MEKLISSKIDYSCPIFDIEEAEVELKDGTIAKRWYVVKTDAVVVVCIKDDKVILLKEFLSATGTFEWRVPAGSIEKGEKPVDAAARELMEEIGLEPLDLKLLKTFKVPSSWIKQNLHCFLATKFNEKWLETGDEQEGAIEVHELSFERIKEMIKNDEIPPGAKRYFELIDLDKKIAD